MHQHSIPNTHGKLRVITGADPAAGADASDTKDNFTRWRIISYRIQLVADANVANRRVCFQINTAGSVIFIIPSTVDQTAGQTVIYDFIAGQPDRTAVVNSNLILGLPPDLWVNQEPVLIGTTTQNLQVGDNFGTPIIYVEEWIENV